VEGIETIANLGPAYAGTIPASVPVLNDPAGFVNALSDASLLVAAYGHTLLEAAHLGVPAIAVVLRPEHREHAEAFCYNGTAMLLDMSGGLDPESLVSMSRELLASESLRSRLTLRGRELVDGRGAERVAAAIRMLV
jgi:UDP-2,4-diacetamido-2,4,6-trideoxy-beta-L-altropyranose hydrolase